MPGEQSETAVPKYGLKLKLDHKYPELRSPDFIPRLKHMNIVLPMILRFLWHFITRRFRRKSTFVNLFSLLKSKQIYGVPIGGIGSGSIGRGFRGEFCRFQMRPGLYEYSTVDANQFIVTIKNDDGATIFQSLLSTFPKTSLKSWETCIDASKCFYTGLYPRSWTEYDLSEYGIKLICRQISPIVPHNYKDSSLPCCIFVWDIKNLTTESRTVTITFTFKNGIGNKTIDGASRSSAKSFSLVGSEGVTLYHTLDTMQCSYSLAAKTNSQTEISKCLYFDPNSDGAQLWKQLKSEGCLGAHEPHQNHIFGEMGCGLATKTLVLPNSTATAEFCLVWDMPLIHFPEKRNQYYRYYTKYFGKEGAALRIVSYAFDNYKQWEKDIHDWQKNVLVNKDLPDWYKSALFNETYYITEGGTIWLTLSDDQIAELSEHDPRKEFGKFGILEGHDYKLYNTYDVHFYASFSLALNWPKLQSIIQYDFRDAVHVEVPEKHRELYEGVLIKRKVKNAVAHDVGDPGEEPFHLLNAYNLHDVTRWRDLNCKFVLQVFRDACFQDLNASSSRLYLEDMYDSCCTVVKKTLEFDLDGDGLIENSGTPDQTYDTWIMTGSSAYCGGLWLAALFAMTKIADILNKDEDKHQFQKILDDGKKAYERKLWNGNCYSFDCSDEGCTIMADQLCGQWYLRSCGYDYQVFPQDNVKTALKTIYENNVQAFCDGKMGAVNGFIDGAPDTFNMQSEEVWTGVTYALAAHMIYEGMWSEGFSTAGGMYKSMTESLGLAFDTPEALYATNYFRAITYMRPLSIWAMQLAVEHLKKKN